MSNQVSKHKSRRFRRFAKANEAVSALEYAILVGVVAVAIGAAIVTFSGNITGVLGNIGTQITPISTPAGSTLGAPSTPSPF